MVRPPRARNYCLVMRSDNELWLRYKVAEMASFFKSPPSRVGKSFRAVSSCDARLTACHEAMYDGRRRAVTEKILDRLKYMGLAVWLLDNGGRCGRGCKNVYFNTTQFGDGAEVVREYFCDVGFPCRLNRSGGRSRVVLSVNGTLLLLGHTAYYFPEFMLDRF